MDMPVHEAGWQTSGGEAIRLLPFKQRSTIRLAVDH